MGVLAGGGPGPDGRPEPSLRPLRTREAAVRHHALPLMRPTVCTASSTSASRTENSSAAPTPSPTSPAIRGSSRMRGRARGSRTSASSALVREHPEPRGHRARLRSGQGDQHRDLPHRGGEESALRPDRALKTPPDARNGQLRTHRSPRRLPAGSRSATAASVAPPAAGDDGRRRGIRVQLNPEGFHPRRQHGAQWVRRSAATVAAYYGQFPARRLQLALEAHSGDGVQGGKTFANPDALHPRRAGPGGHRLAAAGRLGAGA